MEIPGYNGGKMMKYRNKTEGKNVDKSKTKNNPANNRSKSFSSHNEQSDFRYLQWKVDNCRRPESLARSDYFYKQYKRNTSEQQRTPNGPLRNPHRPPFHSQGLLHNPHVYEQQWEPHEQPCNPQRLQHNPYEQQRNPLLGNPHELRPNSYAQPFDQQELQYIHYEQRRKPLFRDSHNPCDQQRKPLLRDPHNQQGLQHNQCDQQRKPLLRDPHNQQGLQHNPCDQQRKPLLRDPHILLPLNQQGLQYNAYIQQQKTLKQPRNLSEQQQKRCKQQRKPNAQKWNSSVDCSQYENEGYSPDNKYFTSRMNNKSKNKVPKYEWHRQTQLSQLLLDNSNIRQNTHSTTENDPSSSTDEKLTTKIFSYYTGRSDDMKGKNTEADSFFDVDDSLFNPCKNITSCKSTEAVEENEYLGRKTIILNESKKHNFLPNNCEKLNNFAKTKNSELGRISWKCPIKNNLRSEEKTKSNADVETAEISRKSNFEPKTSLYSINLEHGFGINRSEKKNTNVQKVSQRASATHIENDQNSTKIKSEEMKGDNSEPSVENLEKQVLLLSFGTEMANSLHKSFWAKQRYLEAYHDWLPKRNHTIKLLEDLTEQILEGLKEHTFFDAVGKICQIVTGGGTVAANLPFPTVSTIGKITMLVAAALEKILNISKESKPNIKRSDYELLKCLEEDVQFSIEVQTHGSVCDRQFKETTHILKKFYHSVIRNEFQEIDKYFGLQSFLYDIAKLNPNHCNFFVKLYHLFKRLQELTTDDNFSNTFCGFSAEDQSVVEIIKLLDWNLSNKLDGPDQKALQNGWEEISVLLSELTLETKSETVKTIRQSVCVLSSELRAISKDVAGLLAKQKAHNFIPHNNFTLEDESYYVT